MDPFHNGGADDSNVSLLGKALSPDLDVSLTCHTSAAISLKASCSVTAPHAPFFLRTAR